MADGCRGPDPVGQLRLRKGLAALVDWVEHGIAPRALFRTLPACATCDRRRFLVVPYPGPASLA